MPKRNRNTLRVKVKFVGPVKQVVGEEQRVVTLKEGTAQELLESIFKLHPEAREDLKSAGVFVDGRLVKNSELRQAILRNGQEVLLILPVAGGC